VQRAERYGKTAFVLLSVSGNMKLIAPWDICLSNKYFHIQLNVKDNVYLLREKSASLFIKETVMDLMMN
jgi:hypothetical protein